MSGEQAEERTAREGRTDAVGILHKMTTPERLAEAHAELVNELAAKVSELEAKLAEANAVSYACGMIYGLEKPFVGGCGKPVPQHESYRCTDCTAAYHRECARTHFETDAMITAIRDKANKELIAGWQKEVSDSQAECSRLASRVELADENLRTALLKLNGLLLDVQYAIDDSHAKTEGRWIPNDRFLPLVERTEDVREFLELLAGAHAEEKE